MGHCIANNTLDQKVRNSNNFWHISKKILWVQNFLRHHLPFSTTVEHTLCIVAYDI